MGPSKSKPVPKCAPVTARDVFAVSVKARDKLVAECIDSVVKSAKGFAERGYQSVWITNDSDKDPKRVLFNACKRPTTRSMALQELRRRGFTIGPETDGECDMSHSDDDDSSCDCFYSRLEISWKPDLPPPYPPDVPLE